MRSMKSFVEEQFRDLKGSIIQDSRPGDSVPSKSLGVAVASAAWHIPEGDASAELAIQAASVQCEEKASETKATRDNVGETSQKSVEEQGLMAEIMQKLVGECERVEQLWHQTQDERLKVQAERASVALERQHVEAQAQKMREDQESSERQMGMLRDESAKTLETLQSIASSTPRVPERGVSAGHETFRTVSSLNMSGATNGNAVPLPRAPNSINSYGAGPLSCVTREKSDRR